MTIIFFGILVPYSVLAFGKVRRNPLFMMLVGCSVNIAMFTERIVVVIPPPSRNILTWGQLHARLGWYLNYSRSGRPVRLLVHAAD